MVSDACLVVFGSCLVVSGDVSWCLVVSGGVWCMSSGVLSDACLVMSGGVLAMSGGVR